MRILSPWRVLAVAAVIGVAPAVVSAQTVTARRIPAGERLEVMLNGTAVGTATPDPVGDATVTFDMRAATGKTEIDANIYVDHCETTYRVWIVELGTAAPSQATCTLRQASGIYWVRPVNTIVVNDVTATIPTLLLLKGAYTPPAPGEEAASAVSREAPGHGLVVFGGGAYTQTTDATVRACGSATECKGDEKGLGFTGGIEYRFNRALSAEVSYVRPAEASTQGGGTGYRFDSAQNANVFAITGKVGVPAGITKVYGRGGMIYNQAKVVTNQSQEAVTVTVDGAPITFPATTQTIELKTDGWGWIFGGGIEVWASNTFAIFGEFDYAQLKGDDVNEGEAKIDNRLLTVFGGLRIHLGR